MRTRINVLLETERHWFSVRRHFASKRLCSGIDVRSDKSYACVSSGLYRVFWPHFWMHDAIVSFSTVSLMFRLLPGFLIRADLPLPCSDLFSATGVWMAKLDLLNMNPTTRRWRRRRNLRVRASGLAERCRNYDTLWFTGLCASHRFWVARSKRTAGCSALSVKCPLSHSPVHFCSYANWNGWRGNRIRLRTENYLLRGEWKLRTCARNPETLRLRKHSLWI